MTDTWRHEDGGVRRRSYVAGARLALQSGESLRSTSRTVMVATMVVVASQDEVFLLCHTGGDDAVSWVERIDPVTLEPLASSEKLPGGPAWPGGVSVHANGDLYVVFGNHAHRLSRELQLLASRELPRHRPYNSFVTLPDGHLVTKDFSGSRPGAEVSEPFAATQLVVLEPDSLAVVATLDVPEASIARLSADDNDVYVVGTTALWRAQWNGTSLLLDRRHGTYRQLAGQGFGWDAVIADGSAWFLDNGEGTHRFAGTLRGVGVATAPLHLVRVRLDDFRVSLTEICGLAGGVVANPPVVDDQRKIVVGFDSGNGILAGFAYDDASVRPLWSHAQNHGSHMLWYPDSGELVSAHHDVERGIEQVVVRDIATGVEKARVDTASPIQSVVFPACGTRRDFYWCSMLAVSRISVA
ncbi:MAG: hypothetical protein RLZZ88_482 [Actinomycetota bacterium]